MTAAAAFRATYSDWKLIRTRKVVQVVLEVPVEQADQAYQVLGGMPLSGEETWVAVARLDVSAPAAVDKPVQTRRPVAAEKRLARQAAICCGDPVFQKFLAEHQMMQDGMMQDGIGDPAATAVRMICGVKSRSEIVPGSKAGQAWERLHGKFLIWRDTPELMETTS